MIDNNSKKAWLNRYSKLLNHIKRLEEKRDILEARITSARVPSLYGQPRGGTPHTFEDLIADKIDIEDRITRNKEKARRVRREILEAIDNIGEVNLCEVLEGRYILLQTPEDLAESLGYNTRHIWTLLSHALELIQIPGLEESNDTTSSPDP